MDGEEPRAARAAVSQGGDDERELSSANCARSPTRFNGLGHDKVSVRSDHVPERAEAGHDKWRMKSLCCRDVCAGRSFVVEAEGHADCNG